jgi:hypothetical protein
MSINVEQLEMSVNLYALQPDFLNSELHYVIAQNDNSFRFATWDEEPGENEEKFYCFLTDEELLVPAGNVLLKQSYILKEDPIYPAISDHNDFDTFLETLSQVKAAKAVRRFYDADIDAIREGLEEKYGPVEKHVVTSRQGQHLLFLIKDIEISISSNMIYFRYKTPFNESHYKHVFDEKQESESE